MSFGQLGVLVKEIELLSVYQVGHDASGIGGGPAGFCSLDVDHNNKCRKCGSVKRSTSQLESRFATRQQVEHIGGREEVLTHQSTWLILLVLVLLLLLLLGREDASEGNESLSKLVIVAAGAWCGFDHRVVEVDGCALVVPLFLTRNGTNSANECAN